MEFVKSLVYADDLNLFENNLTTIKKSRED
jgi:hypothetical protein